MMYQGRELNESEEMLFKYLKAYANDWNENYDELLYGEEAEPFEYGFDFTISIDGNYGGCVGTLAVGGPFIRLNTNTGYLEGFWGASHLDMPLRAEVIEAVDDYAEEYVNIALENHRRQKGFEGR